MKLTTPYQPIDCSFYDYLEHYTTLRARIKVVYHSVENKIIQIENARIVNLTGGRNGEYVHLETPETPKNIVIRMDYLISVGEAKAASFNNTCTT